MTAYHSFPPPQLLLDPFNGSSEVKIFKKVIESWNFEQAEKIEFRRDHEDANTLRDNIVIETVSKIIEIVKSRAKVTRCVLASL